MGATSSATASRRARRVALFHDSNEFGGMEIHVLELLEHLDHDRYEPVVIVPGQASEHSRSPQRFVDGVLAAGVPLLVPPDPGERPGLSFARDVRNLARLLAEHGVDVVHIHTSQPTRARKMTLAAALRRTPLVRTEHLPPTVYAGSSAQRLAAKVFDRMVARFVVVSEANHRAQVEAFHRDPRRLVTIHNGIDVHSFPAADARPAAKQALGIDPHVPVIGAVGRLAAQKGIDVLLHAAARMVRDVPELCVLVIGDGPDGPDLRELAASLGIADHVRFVGFQSEPVPYVQALDVAVMPSRFEGLPLALLEFMAQGKACVVSDYPSLLEAVRDDETAVVVPVDDAPALATALVALLADPARLARLGRTARAVAEQRFDVRRQVVELMGLYDAVLER